MFVLGSPASVAHQESLGRIVDARVSYDYTDTVDGETIRRRGEKVPLIITETRESLSSGACHFVYSIPAPIRRYFAASTEWTWLEIAAFPRFRSKYSAVFYQRAAAVAALESVKKRTWNLAPEELAEILGYVPKKFAFAVFMRDVIRPVLADIEQHVRRFRVEMDDPKREGSGRGRAVTELVFRIIPNEGSKPYAEYRSRSLSDREMAVVHMKTDELSPEELPSTFIIGKAAVGSGIDAGTLSEAWRKALIAAKSDPDCQLEGLGISAELLLHTLHHNGLNEAFHFVADTLATARLHPVPAPPKQPPVVLQRKAPPPPAFMNPKTAPVAAPIVTCPAPANVEEPAVEPAAPVIRKKSDAEKLELSKRLAKGASQEILDLADGYYQGRQFKCSASSALQIMQGYADVEIPPFSSVGRHIDEKVFKDLVVPAVAAIRKMENEQFRKTMINLARAAADWDIPRFLKTCKAIKLNNPMSEVRAAPPQRLPSSMKSPNSTRQVTEASAEYDFADPAYSSLATGFDGAYESDSIFAD